MPFRASRVGDRALPGVRSVMLAGLTYHRGVRMCVGSIMLVSAIFRAVQGFMCVLNADLKII